MVAGAGEIAIPVRPRPAPEAGGKPMVVVFDFVSKYDHNRFGAFVAKNVWAKLDRSKRCVLIEREDLVEIVEDAKFVAKFDDKPADIMKFAKARFSAAHAIWGTVEEVDTKGPVSERRLKISARSASAKDDGVKLGLDFSVTVPNQRAVQLATKEIVRKFFDLAKPEPDVGAAEERRWKTATNLAKNGGFEAGKGHPEFWEPLSNDPKHYQHQSVSWIVSPEGKGKCIKFKLNKAIAATYGVAYYGDPIDIRDGQIYRISIRVRSDGPTVKIFMKHYKLLPPGPNEKKGQWRETRRAPMNCVFEKKGKWQTYVRDFRPHRDDKHDPTITRVELYAYHPAGTVYFDDVIVKKIKDREKK
jgi:hypothetical protein